MKGHKGFVRRDPIVRFMEKVHKTETCWIWTARKGRRGHGCFNDGKSMTTAHRWIYQHTYGKIDSSKIFVCHKCNNPPCVNPGHLYLGDIYINARDAARDGLYKKPSEYRTHCKRGHELSGDNIKSYWCAHKSGKKYLTRFCQTCRSSERRIESVML